MNFEEFKIEIEKRLKNSTSIELQEFQYFPSSFGSGKIIYRIMGHNLKFRYDGKDNFLECKKSKHHQKLWESDWETVIEKKGLELNEMELKNILEKLK